MKFKGEKVLVTGADGFIGSHLVEELIQEGASVRALVCYNSFSSCGWLDSLPKTIIKEIDIVSGDVRDYHSTFQACKGAAYVFHLAALIAIPFSYNAPDLYIDTNVKGTLNVLQAARTLEIQRIIHTSTSEVYGTAKAIPMSEEHPLQAQSPYAASKVAADQLALSFYASFNTPVSIARPFNVYGPRQSARAVIPSLITQIAAGQQQIMTGSLTPTRDFTFVQDTVKGMIAIADSKRTLGEVVNIGSSFEISIKETADLIASLMGKEITLKQSEERVRPDKSEVQRLLADTSKINSLTSWKPSLIGKDGFVAGLKKTVEWFSNKDNLKLYKPSQYNI
jgi:NAD dependent epimerase/dehydratase